MIIERSNALYSPSPPILESHPELVFRQSARGLNTICEQHRRIEEIEDRVFPLAAFWRPARTKLRSARGWLKLNLL